MIVFWTIAKSAVFPIIVLSKNKRQPEDTRPLPGSFVTFYVDWKFLIIALMVEMGIFSALS